ncbi:4-phosphoerythronate dehydrogenase [Acinetobacter sp. ESL0695]|uniref:4-phosphoerythronate dehydrogenase n=1 Tax=Acinetobacter sp. ESL0695 TaxID=2983215 RepID=UPI0023F58FA8|nr:4-phosphoerythronate dehydrogenase [Acinetobacter sp. ESL0695]WEV49517.1 4-phosphoerythronate dehydrogenase [Acinetobacter sp. ESL0695]
MKIVADENLAFASYFFSDIAEIQLHAGRTLQAADVLDSNALLVRSVTNVNKVLLEGSDVNFVGSATIGTDHLDIDYLNEKNIQWANAAGCNAQAVAEYVITALLHLDIKRLDAEENFTLGIVGLGNVGRRLSHVAQKLGWNVIAYDPFVQLETVQQVSFSELVQNSNAISIHVPLTKVGEYPTYHLFNKDVFRQLPKETILINSARGSVISEEALLEDIKKIGRSVVLDVFEYEPKITKVLLDHVSLVTPHIAGYSLEGKARGTQMVYDAFCNHYQMTPNKDFRTQLPKCEQYFKQSDDLKDVLRAHIFKIYPILEDDRRLRTCLKDGLIDQQSFDELRKNYPLRREWSSHGAQI